MAELEQFFRATNALDDKELKFLGWHEPGAAVRAIKRTIGIICMVRPWLRGRGRAPSKPAARCSEEVIGAGSGRVQRRRLSARCTSRMPEITSYKSMAEDQP